MSDTPRTDERVKLVHSKDSTKRWELRWVSADFARQLERELNAANAALSGRTVSCSNCNALAAENAAMREVIKEAHDALSDIASVGREYYDRDMGPNGAEALNQADFVISKLQPYLR